MTESGEAKPSRSARLIQDFVNTLDIETGEDAIGTPAALRQWLAVSQLAGSRLGVTHNDVERVGALREGLRDMLLEHCGHDPEPRRLGRLNAVLAGVPLQASFTAEGGYRLGPGARGGVDAALGRLLGALASAVEDGSWSRLKACAKDSCQWAFYDASRNRSGRWCSMAVCGNRVKMRQRSGKGG